MSNKNVAIGAALGLGVFGTLPAAALAGLGVYGFQQLKNHQPLIQGGCSDGYGHSPMTGRCIAMGGKSHKNLTEGYSTAQLQAMNMAVRNARQMGFKDYSPEMRSMISTAIRNA